MNFGAWSWIFAVIAVFTIWCLIRLVRRDASFMPKWAWALLIVFAMPLGGIVYVLVVVFDAGEYREDAEGRTSEE
ncbi:MAG: PLDc_N domain-containing protein [Acidimicrobiia bacterium]|nr:PLDc_N domain-containing protein [Acidimicrobiia bacterium]